MNYESYYVLCLTAVPGHIVGEGPRPMFLSKLAQSPPSTYSITMHRCFLLSKLQYIETTKGLSVKVKMSLSEHLLNLVECSNHTPIFQVFFSCGTNRDDPSHTFLVT